MLLLVYANGLYRSVYVVPATSNVPVIVFAVCVAVIVVEPLTPLISSKLPHISAIAELLLEYDNAFVVGILYTRA